MSCGIYALYFPNGKSYIGQSNNIERRFQCHQQHWHNPYLENCMKKYRDKVELIIVEECIEEDLTIREQFYLDLLWESGNLLNICRVADKPPTAKKGQGKGKKGVKHTEESKARLSAAMKGRKFTEEHKAKLSAAKIGKTSWNKGKKLSKEHKAKLSAAKIGKTRQSIKKHPAWEHKADIKAQREAGASYYSMAKKYKSSTDLIKQICLS